MTLLIMAAGLGSRYGGLKQLDPVGPGGELIVDYSVFDAAKAGFDKVVFIIKKENLELFEKMIGSRLRKHIEVEYAFQSTADLPAGCHCPPERTKPLGTGHAVWCARHVVKDCFAVINADDFYGRDAFVKLAEFLKTAVPHKYAMAGYILGNTTTKNGYVSRGVCQTENGKLTRVVERTHIEERDGGIAYLENDQWTALPKNSVVSMNCWAFTPELFDALEKGLIRFLKEDLVKNPLKAEFFLPFLVQDEIDAGHCSVEVLGTSAKWYGVTYAEDRPEMVRFLKQAIAEGLYPEKLTK